jgi:Flp pilus assembly protein TadG
MRADLTSPPAIRALRVRRGHFGRNRSAAVAVIFAIAIVPISMVAGLVIDYGWVLQAKSQFDVAADAAALAGVRTAAAGWAAGETSAQCISQGIAAASQWWSAQAGTVTAAQSSSNTPTISQNGQTFTATVAYTATIKEIMPALFNWTPGTASIANSSIAQTKVSSFGTIDFVLDDTSSMMLAKDDASLAILQAGLASWLGTVTGGTPQKPVYGNINNLATYANGLLGWNGKTGAVTVGYNGAPPSTVPVSHYCAFACHWYNGSNAANPQDYYGVAMQLEQQTGQTLLRYDEVNSATQTAIQEMENLQTVKSQLSVGVFSFGNNPDMLSPLYLSTIFPETPIDQVVNGITGSHPSAAAAIAALANILPPVSGDNPDTNIGAALADTLLITGLSGNGLTSKTPQKSIILVTDGVEDDAPLQAIPTTEGPINPAVCQAAKTAGYTIYVLYTPYTAEPVYVPNSYNLLPYITITNGTSPVLSALQQCASSPSDVIVATSQSEINAGMTTLVDEAVGYTTRFTN